MPDENDVIKHKFERFVPYISSSHGEVFYQGIGEHLETNTYHFWSKDCKTDCFWLPEALHHHFSLDLINSVLIEKPVKTTEEFGKLKSISNLLEELASVRLEHGDLLVYVVESTTGKKVAVEARLTQGSKGDLQVELVSEEALCSSG